MTPVATCGLCLTLNLNQLGSYFQSICHRRRQQKDMVFNANLQSLIQSAQSDKASDIQCTLLAYSKVIN